ncbi:hypothetical protein [Sphingomonas sp. SUN039]|uniref:hypothetical protein n=1 Tax=Sphingomonas sp. SUN039 TaxID=2937787 RepID=UPI00216420FC|nr:hypothetical protein [Sphingomonas sp. SUN039]UVO55466.1 hypothetical protein M0209_15545 [Sphingomonas sp. SUN039]
MGLLVGGSALMLAACDAPPKSLRYRMTVEVETPAGLRVGSAVREVKFGKHSGADGQTGYANVRGEAVAVDLPGGRTLFALLRNDRVGPDYGGAIAMMTGLSFPAGKNIAAQADGTVLLYPKSPAAATNAAWTRDYCDPDFWPTLVTFGDILNPKSVERVVPAALDKSFGAGVTLRRITVAVTDDPVTTGIDKRLRWLPSVYETLRGSQFKPKGIPVGEFKRLFSTELGG